MTFEEAVVLKEGDLISLLGDSEHYIVIEVEYPGFQTLKISAVRQDWADDQETYFTERHLSFLSPVVAPKPEAKK